LTRLALLAAALACAAQALMADPQGTPGAGFPSAVERHWLAYSEMQRLKDHRPQ
jgi:hypothetical protein